MQEYQHLCMGCMKPIDSKDIICPHCSYNSQSPQYEPYLSKGTILNNKYLVGKLIDFSTDCAVYIGIDLTSQTIINIHEYLPQKIIHRTHDGNVLEPALGYEAMFSNCRFEFEFLWKKIMSLCGVDAIPQVYDILPLNSTIYAISSAQESITLNEYFQMSGNYLSWQKSFNALKPILNALKLLHEKGIIHGAVCDRTIRVCSDGKLSISGFLIEQTFSQIKELHSQPASGFAPIELYDNNYNIGFYTDVYSVAAVLLFMVSGIRVNDAQDRQLNDTFIIPNEIQSKLPDNVISALYCALTINPTSRTQRISDFQAALLNTTPLAVKETANAENSVPKLEQTVVTEAAVAKPNPVIDSPSDKKKKESTLSLALKTCLTMVLVFILLFFTLYGCILYKNMDIPLFDKAFSYLSFMPINSDVVTDASENMTESSVASATALTETEYVKVADFKVWNYDYIKNDVTFNKNFNIIFEFATSDSVSKNSVISQSIEPGKNVVKGSDITIVICSGVSDDIAIENVIGMSYDEAYKVLTNAGFVVKQTITANPGNNIEGQVYLMSKVAGLTFPKGTEITLSVWGEKPTTTAKTY